MSLLLDTCVFLWLSDNTKALSQAARTALEDGRNILLFSQVSAIEIQIKYTKGKLRLGRPPESIIPESLKKHGISYLPLANDAIWISGKLPLRHQDPFDRLLIGQAIHQGLTLVTPDKNIHTYPVQTLW